MTATAPVASGTRSPLEWLGGSSVEYEGHLAETERLQDLCGLWLDQKGSLYQLLPAPGQSLHV